MTLWLDQIENKPNAIDRAHLEERSIKIEKLSSHTDTGCVSSDVLNFLGIEHRWDRPIIAIGNNVWRAKIGKNSRWHYGRNINEALGKAFATEKIEREKS